MVGTALMAAHRVPVLAHILLRLTVAISGYKTV